MPRPAPKPVPDLSDADITKFRDRIAYSAKPNSCWEWTGSRQNYGYGQMKIGKRTVKTHRIAWKLAYGDIPEELFVLHHCDNPPCVRPGHLFLGTNLDNTLDRHSKGRDARGERHGSRTHPHKFGARYGERNSNVRLTEEQVLDIRRLYAAGSYSQKHLAEMFGVTQPTISLIVNRKMWEFLPDAD